MGLLDKLFGKKKKLFLIKPGDIKEILPNMGGCLATDKITFDGDKIGYMYRETPNNDLDNGWRFFSGTETQEYLDIVENTKVYDLNTIVNYDGAIIPYVDFPIGTELERIPETNKFKTVEGSEFKIEGGIHVILLHWLFKQVLHFSNYGESNIESPNIMISETHKCSGIPIKDVIALFKRFVEIGFLEPVENMEYAHRVRVKMSIEELEAKLD